MTTFKIWHMGVYQMCPSHNLLLQQMDVLVRFDIKTLKWKKKKKKYQYWDKIAAAFTLLVVVFLCF